MSPSLPSAAERETLLDGSEPPGAVPVPVDGCLVRAGASSWADRSLISDGRFYPKKTMTARSRLQYYSQRLPLAEIATTYRFPPTPELASQWAERTPPGFVFDIRAWSLLSGGPTFPDSLYPDLISEVRPSNQDRRRLYSAHLSDDGLAECWARFGHALRPLAEAGRLGVVILQYPGWFTPRPESLSELALAPARLPGIPLAVELRSPKWFDGRACEQTLEWLESLGLALVCIDGPASGPRAVPAVVAATADVAVVRFTGRRAIEHEPWTSPYRYRPDELTAWVSPVHDLASSASEVHLLMDNCWGSDAVDNAESLLALLRASTSG